MDSDIFWAIVIVAGCGSGYVVGTMIGRALVRRWERKH